MRFSSIIQLINPDGTALAPADFADPRTAPGDVKRAFVQNAPKVAGGTALSSKWAFAFESNTPVDTVTFDIWVADESQQQGNDVPDIGDLDMAALKWYLDTRLTGIAMPTAGVVTSLDGPPSGLFYCRVTAITIATPLFPQSYLKVQAFHG